MTGALVGAIPKVIIGNPETWGVAYDLLPNYRPRLVEAIAMDERGIYHHTRPLPLPARDTFILRHCRGALTLAAIVGLYAEAFGLDEDTAAAETFPALKRARMLDLVKRDNRYTDEGLYLRIRRDDGAGGERHRWIFLPPFAQRVLGLCSGAYSCREIAAVMRAERPSVPVRGIPDDALTPAIIACCLALEREGVVAWIDDEGAREARFEAFLRQELEGDSTP